MLTREPGNLSSIPQSHVKMEGEQQSHKQVVQSWHPCRDACKTWSLPSWHCLGPSCVDTLADKAYTIRFLSQAHNKVSNKLYLLNMRGPLVRMSNKDLAMCVEYLWRAQEWRILGGHSLVIFPASQGCSMGSVCVLQTPRPSWVILVDTSFYFGT